jgi:hypothetical protein
MDRLTSKLEHIHMENTGSTRRYEEMVSKKSKVVVKLLFYASGGKRFIDQRNLELVEARHHLSFPLILWPALSIINITPELIGTTDFP